jgi:serine/threonine-protein kinase
VNRQTNTPVAIKTIDLQTIKDEATRSLLENEKSALREISNPNVVKLIEIVEQNGFCYIVTELLEGRTLKELIMERGRLSE